MLLKLHLTGGEQPFEVGGAEVVAAGVAAGVGDADGVLPSEGGGVSASVRKGGRKGGMCSVSDEGDRKELIRKRGRQWGWNMSVVGATGARACICSRTP
jgi:hypothetical protein